MHAAHLTSVARSVSLPQIVDVRRAHPSGADAQPASSTTSSTTSSRPGGDTQHCVQYDGGAQREWLDLRRLGAWRWLAPRTPSGGLSGALCAALRAFGAANVLQEQQHHGAAAAAAAARASAAAAPLSRSLPPAVGQRLSIWCGAAGEWSAGSVLAVSDRAGSGNAVCVQWEDDPCSCEWLRLDAEAHAVPGSGGLPAAATATAPVAEGREGVMAAAATSTCGSLVVAGAAGAPLVGVAS